MSDPYLSQTWAQIDFENASARFTDTSFNAPLRSWITSVFAETATTTTTSPIKGGASLVQTGSQNRNIHMLYSFGMGITGKNWTVDLSFKITGDGTGTWQSLCLIAPNWSNAAFRAWELTVKHDRSALRFRYTNTSGASVELICNYAFTLNTPYDIELCWVGGSLYWLINGILVQTSTSLAAIRQPETYMAQEGLARIIVGGSLLDGTAITGLIDSFRYTSDVGRHTTDYTPESDPFDSALNKYIQNVTVGNGSGVSSPLFTYTQITLLAGLIESSYGETNVKNKDHHINQSPGILSTAFGLIATYNLKQHLPAASVFGFLSGTPTVSNKARLIKINGWVSTQHSTHAIRSTTQQIFAGLGGSGLVFGDELTVINRNGYVNVVGVSLSQYGTNRVEHYRRTLPVNGFSQSAVGLQWVSFARREITPSSINSSVISNHMISGSQYLLPVGFDATAFGSRIIPESQTLYPTGLKGEFGLTAIKNRLSIVKTTGFATGGQQPNDRWGRTHAYNLRQYITMYYDDESGLNPPAWPIWTKIENRNRVIATFGKKETIFAEPIVANNARVLVAQGISAQDAPPFYKSGMVSHRVRTIPVIGIDSFSSSMWGVVYNNARLVKPIGKDCALFGVAKAVKNRRYFDHIGGFDSSVFGTSMTSHRVRTITLDSRYAIAPPSIKLPEVKLFTRYIDGIGSDVSRIGSPSLSIHFNRITPRWTLQDRYGSPAVRNVTPEVHTYGANSEEYGDAHVRLQWRPTNVFGSPSLIFGRAEIAYRDRTRFITGFNAGVFGSKLIVVKSGSPPYTQQTIYPQGVAPTVELFGDPAVNQRVLYVWSTNSFTVFGSVSVVANTIRVEPGYQELLVGSPMVSLKRRTIQVAASPDPSEPSKVRVSPHTIWAVMDAPPEAIKNHPESRQEYVNSYEVFGSAIVTLKHRKIFVQGVFVGGVGTAELTLKKQYVQPVGIRSYRFGWHSIPVTQTIEQYESSDSSATGSHELSRPVEIGPQTIYPLGLDSFQSGTQVIELFNRTVLPTGIASMIMGESLGGDTPYMWQGLRVGPRVPIVANGTDMSSFGLTWISNRVRGLTAEGFESFLCEYQLQAFDKRMKVTRRVIPVVPRQLSPVGIPAFIAGTPNVRAGVHYIRPDGNADQYRKGAF